MTRGWAAWLLGLSAAKISSRDPAVLTEFGHLVETFAAGEILKQVSWPEEAVTAAYFRTQDGDEVDLVLATSDGRVAGFEVKAGSRVQDADLHGLRLLRDRLGERFSAGLLLNLGELAYRKEDRIMIMPLSGQFCRYDTGSSVGNPRCGRGDSNPHGVATNRT